MNTKELNQAFINVLEQKPMLHFSHLDVSI